MHAFLKYGAISVSIFLVALGLRYVPYIAPVRDFLPLSPEAFDRLGEPPTKNFDDNPSGGLPPILSAGDDLGALGSPSSDEESSSDLYRRSFPFRFFEKFDFTGLSGSPVKDFETPPGGSVKQLPVPKPVVPAPAPIAYAPITTPTQVIQVVEKIVERVIVREVERPVPTPAPAISTSPSPKPAPAPTPSGDLTNVCSIQTFDNAAGGASHTLIYRCEGFSQCSITRNGEAFVDVSGKGYFNFPGNPPANYKLRCDDKARVWSNAITPFAGKPLYTQLAFRWLNNDDNEVGGEPMANINQAISYKDVAKNRQIRLRLAVLAERVPVPKGEARFKLQGAVTKSTVSVASALFNYGSICNQIPDGQFLNMEDFENLEFFNNPSVSDKTLLAPNIEDPFYGLAIPQTYQESAAISNINAAIPQNTPAIWDLSLRLLDMSAGDLLCLRLVRQDSVPLDGYEVWPAIYYN